MLKDTDRYENTSHFTYSDYKRKVKKSPNKDNTPIPTLPYDSPEIFPKISANLMSKLNTDSLFVEFV